MSYELLSAKDQKAAKDHFCDWCGEKILKGESYNYRTGVYDGDFQTNKFHPECVNPCMEECDKFECFEPGQNRRPLKV